MLVNLISIILAQTPPPIINGDETKDYPQVVTLYSANSNGQGYNFCSGTLIAERWVLTAAHCVEAFDDNERQGLTIHYAIAGYNLNSNSGVQDYVQIKSWTAHENYNENTLRNDIGIVELKASLTGIEPMPVNKDAIKESQIGEDLRYVGWGITEDGGFDSSKKHFADIPMEDYDISIIIGHDERDQQNVCSGDSGGAALEILGGGKFELAAVNSYVYDYDRTSCEGGYTGGTRVDYFIDWIEGFTPVYGADEQGSDGDSDTDSDGDSDSDSDTDSGEPNIGGPMGEVDEPVKPQEVGENYSSESVFACSSTEAGPLWLAGVVAIGLVYRRKTH